MKSGECTQTIRLHNPDRPKKVGDKLILHTWAGKPYRSKWDWRLETEISELVKLRITEGWSMNYFLLKELREIAKLDGIKIPSVDGLIDTLMKLNHLSVPELYECTWDIIRWPKPTIRRVE